MAWLQPRSAAADGLGFGGVLGGFCTCLVSGFHMVLTGLFFRNWTPNMMVFPLAVWQNQPQAGTQKSQPFWERLKKVYQNGPLVNGTED